MKLTVVIKGSHSRVLRYTSLSAKRDGAADDVKAARRSWSRVAKRVLKSKKPEPKEKKLSGQTAAKPAAPKPSRVSVLKKRADVLKKDVQEKFKLVVRVSELFDKARDAYAKTKSADAKLKLELVAKRLGEVKKKVAESKKKRDAFTQRFRKSL